MWYFAWILGLGLAATVGILNALWYELRSVRERDEASAPPLPTPIRMVMSPLGVIAECAGRPARSRWCKSITMKE